MSNRHSILVVDDDPFMRELTRIHLEGAGHVVVLADGGAEGVAKARSLGPTVIIMDYSMPGLSGTETLKQIRADPDIAGTPVLMLTAWSSDAGRREAETLGATWLEKPLSGERLIDAVSRMVASQVGERLSGQNPRGEHRVLVVDDDPFIQQLAQALLSARGQRVTVVGTGAEALARMAEAPPDLVLLDLGLPDVPGLEVLRHLRAARSWDPVRILMLTASHDVEDIVRAKQAGASGYVCKPIQPDALADMVCDLLEQDTLLWLDDYTRAHRGA